MKFFCNLVENFSVFTIIAATSTQCNGGTACHQNLEPGQGHGEQPGLQPVGTEGSGTLLGNILFVDFSFLTESNTENLKIILNLSSLFIV